MLLPGVGQGGEDNPLLSLDLIHAAVDFYQPRQFYF